MPKESETIRVPVETKQKIEEMREARKYPSVSHTVAMLVDEFMLRKEISAREKAWLWSGIAIGLCIGVIIGGFIVSILMTI